MKGQRHKLLILCTGGGVLALLVGVVFAQHHHQQVQVRQNQPPIQHRQMPSTSQRSHSGASVVLPSQRSAPLTVPQPNTSRSALSKPSVSPSQTPTSSSAPQAPSLSSPLDVSPSPTAHHTSGKKLSLYPETQYAGLQPLVSPQALTGRVGVGQTRWRSEGVWHVAGQPQQLRFTAGQRLTFRFTMRMSNVTKNPQAESVIWQLIGRTSKQTWPGPPVSISVAGNEVHIGGGSHVPDSQGTISRAREKYFQPYPRVVDGRPYAFEVKVFLAGPGKGTLSVSIDGATVVNNQPMPAGTWYEAGPYSHEWVYAKNGFYGGSPSPTSTAMSVTHTNLSLEVLNPEGTSATYRF